MTRAQELLDAATPLPWHSTVLPKTRRDDDNFIPSVYGRPRDEHYIVNIGRGYPGARLDGIRSGADADLIVYAVNALPAYEAAREALEELLNFVNEGDLSAQARIDARAALDRLRDQVPA